MYYNFKYQIFIPSLIFISGFALYLYSSPPALAPYRDMGEMVSVSHTLGVAHPPGYPTYTLIGKISTLIPFANQSYRVNLVSVLGGALSGMFLYLLLVQLDISIFVSIVSVLFWLGASGVWTVSLVTEMYSLNLAAAIFLIYLWILKTKNNFEPLTLYLISFLLGLFIGIRLDLVLLAPSFFLLGLYILKRFGDKKRIFSILILSSIFFLIGFSIYFYLMVRSSQKPYLNWNRPENLEKFVGSLTRKTHGGTLDLLSANYMSGELFFTNLKIYLLDAVKQFYWIGLPLSLLGLLFLYKRNFFLFVLTVIGWVFAGPFFIYKANLPPNPHALAILEAHFLLPNVFIILWSASGLQYIFSIRYGKWLVMICGLWVIINIGDRWNLISKRNNFFGLDYGKNVFRTLPKDSILIMQKDVQLFTFWALQYAEEKRPDVTIVARGLAGSPWYIRMREDAGVSVKLGPLRSESDFEYFLLANPDKNVFVGWDQDIPSSSKYVQIPYGIVRMIVPLQSYSLIKGGQSLPDFLKDIYVYRGRYHYQSQNEFFSSDLIDDYSKAHFARGVEYSKSDETLPLSWNEWGRCLSLNSDNAAVYYRRAFVSFQKGDYRLAARDFSLGGQLYENTYRLTQSYHSLPDVVKGLQAEWIDCLVNLGVALEKLGEIEKSEGAYLKALSIDPRLSRAHYNLAVLYWNRDWRKVVNHLKETLRLDPNNSQAQSFLPKAVYALQRSQTK